MNHISLSTIQQINTTAHLRERFEMSYEMGDQVQILVGGPHENLHRIATVDGVLSTDEVVVYFGDEIEHRWVYSPFELRKV